MERPPNIYLNHLLVLDPPSDPLHSHQTTDAGWGKVRLSNPPQEPPSLPGRPPCSLVFPSPRSRLEEDAGQRQWGLCGAVSLDVSMLTHDALSSAETIWGLSRGGPSGPTWAAVLLLPQGNPTTSPLWAQNGHRMCHAGTGVGTDKPHTLLSADGRGGGTDPAIREGCNPVHSFMGVSTLQRAPHLVRSWPACPQWKHRRCPWGGGRATHSP